MVAQPVPSELGLSSPKHRRPRPMPPWLWAASLAAAALLPAAAWGQASTDPCGFTAGAKWTVNATCNPVAFNKPNGFVNNMIPAGCNGSNNNDAFAWFAGTGNPVIVQYTPPAAADAVLHVLTGTCATPVVVACSDICCGGAVESVTIPTTLGTNYIVRVQKYNANSAMNGTLCVFNGPTPPPNDEPCAATVAAVNSGTTCITQTPGTLVGATGSTVPVTPCYGTPDNDVWFRFTATSTTHYISLNNVAGNTTDLYHAVYSGTCGSLTNLTCSDPDQSSVTGLTVGATYWVRVYSYFSNSPPATTTFNLCITSPPTPPVCGGTFYDSGGAAGNYANNENYTYVICPATPGNLVQLLFSSFQTEAGIDVMNIYDGNSIAAPLIGTYSGSSLPPPIIASNPSGCLTAVFTSDFAVNNAGWAAQVNCLSPPPGNCVYVLRLHDSNGNGWGSSAVQVRINGGPWTSYTVTASDNMVLIGVNLGSLIELNYIASGPNQNQNSYTISKLGQLPYFTSATPPVAGITWSQTVNCGPPPAQPQDCAGGFTVCNSVNITNSSTGTGQVMDLNASNQGCLSSGERQGTWYYFSAQNTGTIGFTIAPANATDDYDFAVWGPYATAQCPTGPPLRCSYAAPPPYSTGLNATAVNTTEGAGGTGWVKNIAATAGQVYVLYIDNFSTSGQAFTLSWQLSGGSSLDCTTLPVELLSLTATAQDPVIHVDWATATEQNSNHFTVERSADNLDFTPIGTLNAAGNAQFRNDYHFVDQHPFRGTNYYRLEQVDNDGTTMRSHTVVATLENAGAWMAIFPNPATDLITATFALPLDGQAMLLVQDATGRTVAQTNIPQQARQVADISVAALAKGWYNLRVALPDGTLLQGTPFLKQ